MEYNSSQREAINHNEGPMLVIAGPGSGKTTVLTRRIQTLVSNYGVSPSNILVITFTKAAAMEMERRYMALSGNGDSNGARVTFGTFHSVFFRILKAAYNYNVNNILREEQKMQFLYEAAEGIESKPDDINEFVQNIAGEISRVKSEGIDINVYYSSNCGQDDFRKIYRYYQSELRRRKLIDFDDMLLYCYELLSQRKDILKAWQDRYRYILIDEFQDINKLQYEVVKLLAKPEDNLFIVGDDDQSIYGFRGSKPEIMLNFEKDYPGAKKVMLDVNYRSTGNIVEAAGRVISENKNRFSKNIRTVNDAGDKVEIAEFGNMGDEYERVVSEIKEGVSSGKKYSDYAVIFRTSSTAEPLTRRLIRQNIPFSMKGSVPDIFEHWIAQDIKCYFNVAMGSRKRSDFIRIMNKPLRYVGRDYLTDEEISFDELEKYYEDKPWMVERLEKMQEDLTMMGALNPFAAVNYLRRGVGYDDYIKEYAKKQDIDVDELMDTIDEIMESTRGFKTLRSWLDYTAEYSQKLRENKEKHSDKDAVALTTMHGSKGLEYDTVYIIDANEGITPHKKAVFDAEIEEERRMFYVAVTRAKKHLAIFYSRKRYNKDMEISRFVTSILDRQEAANHPARPHPQEAR